MRKINFKNRAKNRKISATGSHDFKDLIRQEQQSSHDFRRLQDKFAKLIVNYKKKPK
ncbi:hypothetical protein [Loigolactobacillus jiayinensis]|uniref:YfhE family protein n=1 Tax=Loigolactobacillus jiayinensis TaxID=2486016 RepID=A0ABW1RBN8_9LACO|nr:hypothetical protein [Loigolactobacillus jiayinensis]